jgi:hypothetical protein
MISLVADPGIIVETASDAAQSGEFRSLMCWDQ